MAVEAIVRGLGLAGRQRGDLSDIVGTWVEDPEFDDALADFERIDPEH